MGGTERKNGRTDLLVLVADELVVREGCVGLVLRARCCMSNINQVILLFCYQRQIVLHLVRPNTLTDGRTDRMCTYCALYAGC